MKGERLHNLIISLCQAEKNQVTRYFNRATNPGSKHQRLYRLLSEQEQYDERPALELFGGLSGRARFESGCDYLASLVLESLSEKNDSACGTLPFIEKAMHKGLLGLARRRLEQSMRVQRKRENFEGLYQLVLQAEDLQRQSGMEVRELSKMPRKWVFARLHRLEMLQQGIDEFRAIRFLPEAERQAREAELQNLLGDGEEVSVREQLARKRLQMRLLALARKYEETAKVQQEIMQLIRKHRDLTGIGSLEIEESGNTIRFLIITRQFEEAHAETMRLRACEANSPNALQQKWRLLLSANLAYAISEGKVEQGHRTIEELEERIGLIPEQTRPQLYYYAALFSACNGEWKECHRLVQSLLSLPRKTRSMFSWQPHLMLAVAAIEQQEAEQAMVFLNRMRKSLKNNPTKYPQVVQKGLVQLINLPLSERSWHLRRLVSQVEDLMHQPDEAFELNYFDLPLWIEARFANTTIFELARKDNYQRLKQTVVSISA